MCETAAMSIYATGVFNKGGHGAAGGKSFGSHCVRYGVPRSEYFGPTLMGWNGPAWVVCGMGMGREAGTPFINGDHMGIHKNRDWMGWDETNVSHGGGTPLGLLCHWQCGIAVSLAMWDRT